jgi:hypothetical protein
MGVTDRSSVGCGGVSLFAVLSVCAAPFLPHPLPSKLQYYAIAIWREHIRATTLWWYRNDGSMEYTRADEYDTE